MALIAGEDELAKGECQVKDLSTGDSVTVALDGVVEEMRKLLGDSG